MSTDGTLIAFLSARFAVVSADGLQGGTVDPSAYGPGPAEDSEGGGAGDAKRVARG